MKRNHLLNLVAAAGLSVGISVESASAQVLFSAGSPYTQHFDTLANSGTPGWADNSTLLGWYAAKTNTGTPGSFTAYNVGTGSGNAGGLYSFGASSATERALGSICSGNAAVGNIAYGVRVANDTAQTVSNLTISYTGEQWRNGGNTATQSLAFSYRIDTTITDPDPINTSTWTPVNALYFHSPTVGATAAALNGNDATNRHAFSHILLSGVEVAPGQEIFFRWFDLNDTGSDHGLAIDDLTISFAGPPAVTNAPTISDAGQPQSRTNNAGTIATFTVSPDGTAPFGYRWRKGAGNLSDTGNISGTATATLTISNVLAADMGSYTVVVTNTAGSATSDPADLTVLDPAILGQTYNRTYFSGDTAVFSVTVGGTPTLSYQWWDDNGPLSDGGNISGATTNTLTIANLDSSRNGHYYAIVTNSLGSAMSTMAMITVLTVPSAKIAQWTFNDINAPINSPPPAVGNGTASVLNGVTATWASGCAIDPGLTNEAWNTTRYPAATLSNTNAGVQFNVSTRGYTNILIAWEQNNSDTASKYARPQYSTDGTNFTDLDPIAATGSFAYYSRDLSLIPEVQDNPNFAFRIVSEWESTATGSGNDNYVAIGTTSNYGTNGTMRFDLVSVFGEAISLGITIPSFSITSGRFVAPGQFALTWSPTVVNAKYCVLQRTALSGSTWTTNATVTATGASAAYTNSLVGTHTYFRIVAPSPQ